MLTIENAVAEVNAAITEFRNKYGDRLDATDREMTTLRKAVDTVFAEMNHFIMGGILRRDPENDDAYHEHARAFYAGVMRRPVADREIDLGVLRDYSRSWRGSSRPAPCAPSRP